LRRVGNAKLFATREGAAQVARRTANLVVEAIDFLVPVRGLAKGKEDTVFGVLSQLGEILMPNAGGWNAQAEPHVQRSAAGVIDGGGDQLAHVFSW